MNLKFCFFVLVLIALLICRTRTYLTSKKVKVFLHKDRFLSVVRLPGIGESRAIEILLSKTDKE